MIRRATWKTRSALLIALLAFTAAPALEAEAPRPATDPFKSLHPPLPEPAEGPSTTVEPSPAPPPPPPRPVQFSVIAIGRQGAQAIALVEHEGQTHIVGKGDAVPPGAEQPAFIIQEIEGRAVRAYDPRVTMIVKQRLAED